ncbi:hypothetical protein [uncultured Mediterranean phage uvMED]|nr:hypothetical protein [uncultured Mediterranean phage uvMED]
MYEDDPIAEEYDKYGKYYPVTTISPYRSQMAFVTDHQERMATQIVNKWNLKSTPKISTLERLRSVAIADMIMRWNSQESL